MKALKTYTPEAAAKWLVEHPMECLESFDYRWRWDSHLCRYESYYLNQRGTEWINCRAPEVNCREIDFSQELYWLMYKLNNINCPLPDHVCIDRGEIYLAWNEGLKASFDNEAVWGYTLFDEETGQWVPGQDTLARNQIPDDFHTRLKKSMPSYHEDN